ncbi:hypothetical protein ACFWGD_03830 [Corynebacterium sp. NPDC060344]|uniref:hypothetical protein n=1 Tax=Corynebacterium sp. NPDC060344 TaxID=3347101 RepID=UPI00365B5A7C
MTKIADADAYWASLVDEAGVNRTSVTFMGNAMQRTVVRTFDGLSGAGVLESLVGSSSLTHADLHGRMLLDGSCPEWFRMEISPAFNTWAVTFEHSVADANLGADGRLMGSEKSPTPMPRAHIQHPSTLVYFEQLPMWGGHGHHPPEYLPSSSSVVWTETAHRSGRPTTPENTDGSQSNLAAMDWRPIPSPGDFARIELTSPDHPDADGTAIFDLRHRMCLFFELRYQGEPRSQLVVDAARIGDSSEWRRFGANVDSPDGGDPSSR